MFKKLTFVLLILVVGFFITIPIVFAQNVVVSEDVTIYLSGAGRYFTLLNTSSALDQLQINDAGTAFTVTTNLSTGIVKIKSTEGVDIGGTNNTASLALTSCDSTGSILTIQANITTVVTVTVTPPTSGSIICSSVTPAVSSGTGGVGPVIVSEPTEQQPSLEQPKLTKEQIKIQKRIGKLQASIEKLQVKIAKAQAKIEKLSKKKLYKLYKKKVKTLKAQKKRLEKSLERLGVKKAKLEELLKKQ